MQNKVLLLLLRYNERKHEYLKYDICMQPVIRYNCIINSKNNLVFYIHYFRSKTLNILLKFVITVLDGLWLEYIFYLIVCSKNSDRETSLVRDRNTVENHQQFS